MIPDSHERRTCQMGFNTGYHSDGRGVAQESHTLDPSGCCRPTPREHEALCSPPLALCLPRPRRDSTTQLPASNKPSLTMLRRINGCVNGPDTAPVWGEFVLISSVRPLCSLVTPPTGHTRTERRAIPTRARGAAALSASPAGRIRGCAAGQAPAPRRARRAFGPTRRRLAGTGGAAMAGCCCGRRQRVDEDDEGDHIAGVVPGRDPARRRQSSRELDQLVRDYDSDDVEVSLMRGRACRWGPQGTRAPGRLLACAQADRARAGRQHRMHAASGTMVGADCGLPLCPHKAGVCWRAGGDGSGGRRIVDESSPEPCGGF